MPCKHQSYNDNEEYFICDWYGNIWFSDGDSHWLDEGNHCVIEDGCEQYREAET